MKVASTRHAALYLVTRVSSVKVSAEVRLSCSSLVPAPGLSSEDRK